MDKMDHLDAEKENENKMEGKKKKKVEKEEKKVQKFKELPDGLRAIIAVGNLFSCEDPRRFWAAHVSRNPKRKSFAFWNWKKNKKNEERKVFLFAAERRAAVR